MHALITSDKPLPERVAEAHMPLVEASVQQRFETEVEEIEHCFRTVKQGGFGRMTLDELERVAFAVAAMYGRLPPPIV